MILEPLSNETWVELNKQLTKTEEKHLVDIGKRKRRLELYCQSCCYCYLGNCMFADTLRPYDMLAENCPDFIPKDYYKPKSKAKCWKKRLKVDPTYEPLPENSNKHWKIETKKRVLDRLKRR